MEGANPGRGAGRGGRGGACSSSLPRHTQADRADEITVPQHISALKLLLAYDLSAIRRFARDDEEEAGRAAHKFSKVFAQNANRGRTRGERAEAALHVVADLDDDDPAA